MSPLTPDQLRTRGRVEGLIRLMAPALDLVLAVGDRVSRVVERDDVEYYPPRVTRGESAVPRGVETPRPGAEGPAPTAEGPPPTAESPPHTR